MAPLQFGKMFHGTFTALVTPFRNGGVDVSAFEKLIETQIAGGITGIVAIGTTGESPTLSHKEREQLIRLAVATANQRCLVLAGTGSNATDHAVVDTKLAEKLGVDGALLVAPYYNKPSQEGLFRHFKTIAAVTSLPIMLYNIPGRCGVDIMPETVVRLAKECPSQVCGLVRACESGDFKSATQLHRKLLPLFKDLFIEPNPVPVKTALGWRGVMSGEVRLPLCEMIEVNQARLRKTLEQFEQNK